MTDRQAVHYSSASPEWNTPRVIVDAAIETLEVIDIDPCGNSHDRPNVPARTIYTRDDDGLSHRWNGRLFLNPPYGREVSEWVNKTVTEIEAGRITEAVILVAGRTDTRWFDKLAATCELWCAIRGRLHFSDGPDPAPFPSAVFYYGPNPIDFHQAFQRHGKIWTLATPPARGTA